MASNGCLKRRHHSAQAFAALAGAAVLLSAASAWAQTYGFDFDAVTRLARGGIVGENVAQPVPGYELRLLKHGNVVYDQSFGNFQNGRVVNVDSSTKTLAGGLIMSMTDSSALPFSLDTRIAEYVPAFTGPKSTITVRQAFSHTSGLDGSSNAISNSNLTLQQAAAAIGVNTPLLYGPPGTQFSYGGTSMHAAGAAAEIAGGKSWNELFAERITGPLQMTQTRFALTSPANPRIAGGVESNAVDFGRYMDMLLNDGVDRVTGVRVLFASSVGSMLGRQTATDVELINTPLPGVTDYGVGIWLDQRDANGALIGAIAGGARGFCSWLDLDDGYVGVIATESTTFSNIRELSYLVRDATQAALRTPRLAGDANGDGGVEFADLVRLAQNYQRGGRLWAEGDFSGDGRVDFVDLVALAQNYGAGSVTEVDFQADWALAQSVVPEPAVTVGIAWLWLTGIRFRRSARQ